MTQRGYSEGGTLEGLGDSRPPRREQEPESRRTKGDTDNDSTIL